MTTEDDTMDTSGQGRETAAIAMAEAGLLPGVRPMRPGDTADPGTLVLYRVPADAVDLGGGGGLDVAQDLLGLARQGHAGRIMLAFDGWAGDDRALAQVPRVARFAAAMLLGPHGIPHQATRQPARATEHARQVLGALVDELALAPVLGDVAWEATGRAWLVAHAWASVCFAHGGSSGLLRDLDRNMQLLNAVQHGLHTPPAGQALL